MKRFLIILTFVCMHTAASAQMMPGPARDPFLAVSESRKTKLWVNPSDPDGIGPCFCKLTIDGKVAWQKNLPFTFEEVAVSNSGMIGGFFTSDKKRAFQLVILDSQGQIRLNQEIPMSKFQMVDGPPDPRLNGIIMDESHDRMILRISNLERTDGSEKWWIYRLSSAKFVKSLSIGGNPRNTLTRIEDAKLISGTPLILVNWDQFGGKLGQSFTLVDQSGNKVWGLNLVGDFERGTSDESYSFSWKVLSQGTILDTSKPNQFEIRMVKSAQRVTFDVRQVAGQWKVTEVSRRPFDRENDLKKKIAPLVVPRANIPVVKKFSIPQSADLKSDVSDIGEFHFWGSDKIVFVRQSESNDICVIDLHGSLLRKIPLPNEAQGEGFRIFLAKTSGSNFVVVTVPNKIGPPTLAWNVDVSTGNLHSLPKFSSYFINGVAGFRDGRFAVASMDLSGSGGASHVSLHAADGSKIWEKGDGWSSNRPEELLSPEDVDFDANGNIAVLDNIRHTIQFFQQSGKFIRAIDLDKKWGKKASYPTNITCLPDGRMWVIDMAVKPLFLLDKAGNVIRNVRLTLGNGKAFDAREDVKIDSNGNPWLTNGRSFFRINEQGLAIQTIGNKPRVAGLGKINGLHVNFDGKVYALDEVSNSVHVFDSSGKSLFTATPKAKEFDDSPNYGGLDVTKSGDIYLRGSKNAGKLHFSPTGQRLADIPYVGMQRHVVEFGIPFYPQPTWSWHSEFLLDGNGKVRATLRRWPDLTWMEDGPSCVSPGGEIMALSNFGLRDRALKSRKLAFFTPNGKPINQVSMPLGMPDTADSAFDGKLCYFVTKEGLLAIDRAGKPQWIFTPPNWNSRADYHVFPSLGKIALYDGKRTITWIDPAQAKMSGPAVKLSMSERAEFVLKEKA